MRILYITATRIGDAVLSTGLLSHLIGLHPEARFTIAAGPAAAPLFEAMPGLERSIAVPKERFGLHWPKRLAVPATVKRFRGSAAPLAGRHQVQAAARSLPFTASLRAFARSVFSQEKEPSRPALRPKWP